MTREEAIDFAEFLKNNWIINFADMEEFCDMAIEALQQESKRGEWIFNPKDAIESMFTKPRCSECGFESSDGGNFCPNCGSKMDKEKEE